MTPVERLQAAIEKLQQWSEKPFWPEYADEVDALLHRTIDAQLAILRGVLEAANIERHWETLVYTRNALVLADAILGGVDE